MSKDNNLHDFLTDIADAVREKKGTTEPINAQNLSSEIRSIEAGGAANGFNFTGEVHDQTKISQKNYKSIRFNEGVTVLESGFIKEMTALESLYLPSSLASIPISAINRADSLSIIEVDERNPVYDSRNGCNAVIRKSDNVLMFGCKDTIIPEGVTKLGYGSFSANKGITEISFPSSVTSIEAYCFNTCSNLTSVIFNEGFKSIGVYALSSCQSLKKLVFPSTVNLLQLGAFYANTAMVYYDFSKCKSVPKMDNANAFSSIPTTCAIVVPDDLYDEWIVTTNWSTYASKIVKDSEYTRPL